MKNNSTIVLLLLSVGLFYTFTNAQYQDVKKLNILVSDYQNVLQNVAAIAELRDVLLSDYGTVPKMEIDRLNKVLPNNIDNVRLALDLDSMAARYGVSIKNIKTTTEAGGNAGLIILPEYASPYEKVTVSFSFVASYEDFMGLLVDIEKNLRIMDINAISFQATESGLYDYLVSADTYWLK